MKIVISRKSIQMTVTAIVTMFLLFLAGSSVYAAAKINIWHNDLDSVARYTNIYVGKDRQVGLKVEDTTVNSATWKSTNAGIMSVSGDKTGATLNAHTEGTVTISVSASTEDGVLSDSVTACAITKMDSPVNSYTNTAAEMLRGATSDSAQRGKVEAGFNFQILGECGNYYYVSVPADYDFKDGNPTRNVFVLKEKLDIPATNFNITAKSDKLEVGVNNKLSYELLPSGLANMNEKVIWESSDTDVATIDSAGNINVLKVGEVTFTGTIQDSSITNSKTFIVMPAKSKLKTEIVGFKDVKLSWSKSEGVDGYEIERYDSISKEYKRVKKIEDVDTLVLKDTGLKDGTEYKYRVRSFIDGTSETIYSDYSNILEIKTGKLSIDIKTDIKAKIKWNQISGVSGFEIYRSGKDKKFKKITDVNAASTSYSNTGLKQASTYYYRIRPYIILGGEKEYNNYTDNLTVATYGITNGYFYDQVKWKKIWPGVKITNKKATTATMNDYTVYDSKNSGQFKPSIKYNYSTKNKKLYIHVYVKFSGAGQNKKFEYYKHKTKKTYVKYKTGKSTYKSLAKAGFKKYWGRSVTGDKYDFKKGVNFKTAVILHETGSSGQHFIAVKIGVNGSAGKSGGQYWHFASGFARGSAKDKTAAGRYKVRYGYSHTGSYMHLATQAQTAKGIKSPEKDQTAYMSVAGHELGHCLGLDDGYTANGIKRMIPTSEIGTVNKAAKYGAYNIMAGTRKYKAVDNDIEMALQAQGDAINNKSYSWQSYKTYAQKEWQHKKSSVIRR